MLTPAVVHPPPTPPPDMLLDPSDGLITLKRMLARCVGGSSKFVQAPVTLETVAALNTTKQLLDGIAAPQASVPAVYFTVDGKEVRVGVAAVHRVVVLLNQPHHGSAHNAAAKDGGGILDTDKYYPENPSGRIAETAYNLMVFLKHVPGLLAGDAIPAGMPFTWAAGHAVHPRRVELLLAQVDSMLAMERNFIVLGSSEVYKLFVKELRARAEVEEQTVLRLEGGVKLQACSIFRNGIYAVVLELYHPVKLATEIVAAQWAAFGTMLRELMGGAIVTGSAVAELKAGLKAGAVCGRAGGDPEALFGSSSQTQLHRDSGKATQFGGSSQTQLHLDSRKDTQFGSSSQTQLHRDSRKATQFGGSASKNRKFPKVTLRHRASDATVIGSFEETALVVQHKGNKQFFDSSTWNPSSNKRFRINLSKLPITRLISLAKHGGRQVPGPGTTFEHSGKTAKSTSFGIFSITAVEE
jgi:hypothetical protein